mmetsp:Transcript_48917/g.99880  ORF Transcript_48917/g.99880 Transcript_48917/m.99880 type:complete len:445 (+) Transcript_48917:57-1391(+)|eukprot:CAMPEP_0181297604 /NCGR_PEP_ID=MMETSP1101-20121128/5328_1 /TAXON_ID=46948 /ORGANISM="Rhodomonas abbreviata, Strain Caron Lab Isolate" /LENGTH=444 /DNA_ID=CAMNT_0023402551 /DNA_START=55 /DNA_END=1389 /DNA_ORIENTATION=+
MPPNSHIDGAGASSKDDLIMDSEKDLAEDHVAIDGVVYSLKGWDHPGGDQIKLFGGNDVSVQYRMIHPFHAASLVQKMPRVGRIKSARVDYTFGSAFEKDLKDSVAKIVKPNQRFATPGFYFRLTFYVSLYWALLFSYVYYGSSWLLCAALGVSQAFIGLNVQHDANHGAISAWPVINEIFGFGADLIGGSKYLWLQQHWTHHAFTNDVDRDPDATSTDPFFLFHNYPSDSPMRKAMHAFQHFYMLPVLSFYWISSVFNTTAISVTHTSAKQAGMRFENSYLEAARPITWALRAFYIATTALSPFLYHAPMTALAHVWFMSICESLALAIPFALSHNFEHSERQPVAAGPVNWYKSQVETSCTYGGKVAGWLTGGLNFQIEHHLFPRMSSAWYPYIQPTVQEVCARHGVRYEYYPSFFSNARSTLSYVAAVGAGDIAPPSKKDK